MATKGLSNPAEQHVSSEVDLAQLQNHSGTTPAGHLCDSSDKPALSSCRFVCFEDDRIMSMLLIERECRNLIFDEATLMLAKRLSLVDPDDVELQQFIFDCYQELDMRTYHNPNCHDAIYLEISTTAELLSYAPIGDPNRPGLLRMLTSVLEQRFEMMGTPSKLNMAISCYYQLILLSTLGDTHVSTVANDMSSLGGLCYSRFQHTGNLWDISQAITCYRYLVNHISTHTLSLCRLLNGLGGLLYTRHEFTGELADIDQAILAQTAAVSHFQDRDVEEPECLSNLGLSYMRRFEALNQLSDIDASIQYVVRALSMTPDNHPDRSGRLCNLGNSYCCRYERFGDHEDLKLAIFYHRDAVTYSAQDEGVHALCLDGLGTSLLRQSEIQGQVTNIDQIVSCHLTAVHLTSEGHPLRSERLNNLGNAYARRFVCLGQISDLDMAIQYQREAVILTSEDHPNYLEWLENLGLSSNVRFEQLRKPEDLSYAIQCLEQATYLTSVNDSRRPGRLARLGTSIMLRFRLFGRREDLNQLVFLFKSAALSSNGDTSTLFRASHLWAMTSKWLNGLPCLEAYRRIISLVPKVVWIGANMSQQYTDIPKVSNVVIEAVDAAMTLGDYGLALEWFEQGRSIVWNQMGQLRTPMDDLCQVNPMLVDELNQVARRLDQAHASKPGRFSVEPQNLRLQEDTVQTHHWLAQRWESLLSQAREIPGFQGFLKPKPLVELVRAAKDRTIVVIVVEKQYCSALALLPRSQDLIHVSLPDFSYDTAAQARADLVDSLRNAGIQMRGVRADRRRTEDKFESVLSMLWLCVVRPILDRLGYIRPSSKDEFPHVTWCATGPLAFLPLHAAGLYHVPQSRAFDFVVSSYTPNISSLTENLSDSNNFQGLLAVGQATAPGLPPLKATAEELDRIAGHTTKLKFTRLDEELADSATVLEAMKHHSWVHLACHGSQNKSDPTASAFHLRDGPLDLATIFQKKLPHASFAFLSACQTATGDEKIPEECVHLAAGMVMAGYRSVIGTMWSIRDVDAPVVADRVYAELLKDGLPDSSRAAVALHMAMNELREKVGDKLFSAWVPWIHIGA